MQTLKIGTLFLVGISIITACSSSTPAINGSLPSSSTPSLSVPSAPTVTTSAPLALTMYTVYDNTKYVNNLTFDGTTSTTCAASDATPNVTCTITIPEGRLYFSSLNFSYSWTTTSCKLMTFQPYYYMASQSASYVPPGAPPGTTLDCSGSNGTPPAACWGGAAPTLVDQFPTYRALIHLPDESIVSGPQSKTLTLQSGFSQHTNSNRTAVNDMDPTKIGTTFTPAQVEPSHTPPAGDGYIANTYVNYKFTCRDNWFDPLTYTINLVVKDQNDDPSGTQALDDFFTWSYL